MSAMSVHPANEMPAVDQMFRHPSGRTCAGALLTLPMTMAVVIGRGLSVAWQIRKANAADRT